MGIFVLITGMYFFLVDQSVYARGQDGQDGEDGKPGYAEDHSDDEDNDGKDMDDVTSLIKDMGGKPQKTRAPNITLPTFDGEDIALRDYRGRTLFLSVWNSRCGYCRQEAPYVVELANALADNPKIDFLGVSIDIVEQEALDYIEEFDISYTVVADSKGAVIKATPLKITGTPSVFIISPEGYIIGSFSGFHEWHKEVESLEKLADQLL